MTLPLSGLSVLDMGDEAMVLAARLLADLGADVVRVEATAGDRIRRRGPFAGGVEGLETGLAHILYNAGKRSLALALDRPEAWKVAAQLVPRADVIVAPLEQPGHAKEFFVDSHIRALSRRVGVVDAVFRRGSEQTAVTDLVGTAAGGLLYLNGYEEDPPNKPAGQLAYKQTSLAAAFAAISLILACGASGEGGRVTVSMQEAVMWTTIQSANENYWPWHRVRPGRRGLGNLGGQTVFEAKDGRWVSFYQHPPYWGEYARWVAEALGDRRFLQPEWDDPLFRFQHNDEVTPVTAQLCSTMPRDELVGEGQRRSILVVPVQGVADIATDPHLRERGFFQQVWYEQLGANLEVMRPPFISSAYQATAARAPALGEHSRAALHELGGFSEDAIERLIERGIVGVSAPGGPK